VTDDLERRLRAADPVASADAVRPAARSLRQLMEATMTTDVEQSTRSPRTAPAWRLPALVAAAVAVLAVGIGAFTVLGDDAPPAASPPPALELTLPGSGVMASCIQYSVDVLADMPVAFSGEVTAVEGDTVVLDVDRWYRGGDAERVELIAPAGDTAALIGTVDFAPGKRYLVTATGEGAVNSCGYTAEWSPTMAADFEKAFAG
jgi:hypothetical protein